MIDLLFDAPWWLVTVLIVVGAAVFVWGNKRQKSAIRAGGAGVIILAIALLVVSYLALTQKEKCVAQARNLVHAVGEGKFDKARTLLDSQTTVNGRLVGPSKIIPVAEAAAQTYKLSSLSILSSDVQQLQTVITVSMTILAQSDSYRPTRVDCQFQWNQSADGWRLQNIDITNIGGQNPDELMRHLPRF